jgi:hypothetical protein
MTAESFGNPQRGPRRQAMIGRTLLAVAIALSSLEAAAAETGDIKVYDVGRRVSDFPAEDDFSSPEAAYATINRHMADGQGDWRSLSVKRLGEHIPNGESAIAPMPADRADEFRNAEILSVRTYRGEYAHVVARVGQEFDTRWFETEGGRWLNAGNSRYGTAEQAARQFDRLVARRIGVPRRPPVDDPQAALKPLVEYLQQSGQPPKEFVLDVLAGHRLVGIGELHHRPTYWALNSEVVRDPRFAQTTGTIYLELPSHAQGLVDRFLVAKELDPQPVIEMLRDNLWMGWPDQAMLDFFTAVWQTNQALEESKRIRIVLVDMARPWAAWLANGRIEPHPDRDRVMARNLLADMGLSDDPRHGLFIVGYGHLEQLTYAGTGNALRNAGWYLRRALREDLYTIVQHGPIIANMGGVSGRTCLGMFDEAFAAAGNRPVAFALAGSPFGRQRFDANADQPGTASLYAEAFDGYVYLGPLEDEVFSPLIPSFYTDDFVRQLDRRVRLESGHGLVEAYGLPAVDARSFDEWMGRSWGQPREWTSRLGPVTAWHDGDDWEAKVQQRQYRLALEKPEIITAAAKDAFDALRTVDARHKDALWNLPYQVDHYRDGWVDWLVEHLGKDPIRTVEVGPVQADSQGRPAVSYTITLTSGDQLTGVLPFQYDAPSQTWYGVEGLDWHLKAE